MSRDISNHVHCNDSSIQMNGLYLYSRVSDGYKTTVVSVKKEAIAAGP